jgi:hypothetical protein
MEHPIWQQTHLGVAAFAGMLAQSVRQGDYLLESQQHRSTQDVATQATAGKATTEGV